MAIWRSYTVRALAADLLTDVGVAAGVMALELSGGPDVVPAVVWGLVAWSAVKKIAIAGVRLLAGETPESTHPRRVRG